ncbi:Cilia- and flagella-associated protein 44 [Chytridiales sp. JEL 0842]|nr:Cilia- and flagella-associated protein 44 [Chytridiales sp. JEL 0842]
MADQEAPDAGEQSLQNAQSGAAEPATVIDGGVDSQQQQQEASPESVQTQQESPTEQKVKTPAPKPEYYDLDALANFDDSLKLMPKDSLALHCAFGLDSFKRNNLHYLDEFTLLTSIGNILVLINLKTLEQTYYQGIRDGSIGAIAVHPSKNYIAVAEVHPLSPNIYIFEYPSMKLYRILRGSTTKAYANLCFTISGDKLASVGSDPDYMLTIWKWKDEHVILKSKAFSQDVYKVAFAPDSDGFLTTSGMGHIKFWSMSDTFTGLKLKGYLGKFGASELTDISAFIQLPDGKVLSSTETGNLLLWDGGMIKCELAMKGKKPCHQGKVESVLMIEGEVFTAGEDGFVRIWDFETIDTADVTTTTTGDAGAPQSSSGPAQARIFEMDVMDEFLIGKDVKIKTMVRCPANNAEYLIQDTNGHLFKLDTKKRTTEKIVSFHAGGVAASLDARGRSFAAGFTDGVLRILTHTIVGPETTSVETTLHHAFKPHKAPITSIAISPDGSYLATLSEDRTAFFFKIDLIHPPKPDAAVLYSNKNVNVTPLGFLELESQPVTLTFSPDNHLHISEFEPQDADTASQEDGSTDESDSEDEEDEQNGDKETGKKALLTLKDGSMVSLVVPPLDKVDTKMTYSLDKSLLAVSQWVFNVPPKPIVKEEVKSGSKANLAEAASEAQGSAAAAKPSEPITPVEKNEEQSPAMMLATLRKDRGLVIAADSPFNAVFYLEGGYFLAAVTNKFGEGEIRACKFGSPEKSRLLLVYKTSFTDIRLSLSGKYLVAGTIDGMVCLCKIKLEDMLLQKWDKGHEDYASYSALPEAPSEIQQDVKGSSTIAPAKSDQGQYWIGHVHDCEKGRVNTVATTFDDSFLVSCGSDGGIFVWRNLREAVKKSEAIDADEMDNALTTSIAIEDIVDPATYSIQESKVKSEKDRELHDAEIKKQATRNYISEVRAEYLRAIEEATIKAPEGFEVRRAEVQVDPYLRNDIETETTERIAMVKKELAWISEKESIGPNKLKKKFLDDVETEFITISSFRTQRTLSTFRTTKLDASYDLAAQVSSASERAASRHAKNGGAGGLDGAGGKGAKDGHGAEGFDTQLHAAKKTLSKPTDARSKLEARKALRAERGLIWKKLMDDKPDDSYEDPRDVAAIRYAETHMGDFKLKTGAKYIVPESERVDADKKKRQIILLKESVHSLKEQFNARVLRLRDKKKALIEYFKNLNAEIQCINSQLKELGEDANNVKLWWPELDVNAYPEMRYVVTDKDIQDLKEEETKQTLSKNDNDFGGFGGGNAASSTSQATGAGVVASGSTSAIATSKSRPQSGALQLMSQKSDEDLGVFGSLVGLVEKMPLSSLEIEEQNVKRKTLKYQRDRLLQNIEDEVAEFDAAIQAQNAERIALEADITFADMRLLLLYKEWVLLKEFEKYDKNLADKLNLKRNEKMDIDTKIKECQDKLNSKRVEIEQIVAREKENQEDFTRALGENNKYEDLLTKIFKKKIKRSKKKVKADGVSSGADGEEEEAEESEEESDYDDMDDSDDDNSDASNEDDAPDECPPDCDSALFAKIIELREIKLDQEDLLSEIQKAIEAKHDGLIKKEKVIDAALRTTEAEIQDFQTQKQQKLNELDVVVPLRLHQVENLERNALPKDLSQSLVFVNEGLHKLKNRIKELQQEKLDIRKQHKELKKMHVALVKNRKEKQEKLTELESRATDVQMLKFGQIIDLEKLERMGINRGADELREKLQKEDNRRQKELEQWDSKINSLKEDLTEVTKNNTYLLETLVTLTETKRQLEDNLNQSQSAVMAEYSGLMRKDVEERDKLIRLVQTQSDEISQLKGEIELLIRKPMRTLPSLRLGRSFKTASGGGLPPVERKGFVIENAHAEESVAAAADAVAATQ